MSNPYKRIGALLMMALLSSACTGARLHHDGLDAVDNGRYEEGLVKLEQATRENPRNLEYRLALKSRHDEAVLKLLGEGDRARGAGKPEEAERSYHRVLVIEAGNDRAQRGLDGTTADRRHNLMVAKAGDALTAGDYDNAEGILRAILSEDPGFAAANAMRAKIDTAKGPIKITPRLKSHENRPVTLQFRDANTKMVFEVLSRQTGINFVFDKDVKSEGKTTIFVQQVPVEQAVELVLGQNQLARQVLSDNMVMIYPNTAAKQKEYQDEIVKTFYLTNADPKKAQELLKTVLNTKTLFVDDKANLIIMRDTPEAVRMAEKLIASLDLAESEVMLEVEVLEITRSRLQQLGINYPTSGSISTPDNLNLDTIGRLSTPDFAVSQFKVSVDALKQVGETNTLASPRIRARNREKARILIGSRVPVITNSVTPTSSGTAVVTGNVQYLDVGLTLEVEPTVHLDNQVSIKLNLEVSSITRQVTVGSSGTLAYEIGTRNAQTLLSLKDGETQILAGLIQDSDTRNSAHIPGLGDIPIVGRLFGSKRNDKAKTEIVLSITPRVIRSSARPPSETTEFWYGTESNVRSAPLGSQSDAAGASRAADSAPAADLSAAAGSTTAPASVYPTTARNLPAFRGANRSTASSGVAIAAAAAASAPVVTMAAAAAPATEPASPAADSPESPTAAAESSRAKAQSETGERPSHAWSGSTQVKAGQEFELALNLSSQQALIGVKSQLRYDGHVLQLLSADAGGIVPTNLSDSLPPRINQAAGAVQFVVPSTKDSPVQGDGSLLTLRFKALTAAPSTAINLQFAASNADGMSVPAMLPAPLQISVEP